MSPDPPHLALLRFRATLVYLPSRLEEPSKGLAASSVLLVRTGRTTCALPLSSVVETMRPLPIAPLSGMPPFVAGGAVVRGEPVPVVDLGALVAGAAAEAPRRFVLLRLGERHAALAADAVVGVAQLAQGASAGASVLSGAAAGAVELLGALDGELLLVLRAATIVPEGAWEALRALPGAA